MACKDFFTEQLPLLSAAVVAKATGKPDALPRTLIEKCRAFLKTLRKGQGQLRHYVKALPLPMTHCTVCWRAADATNRDFAELAYEQRNDSSKLQRITGSVFSRLCGHRPPYCCDAAWHSADVLETFVRYDQAREVHEAPFNPGSCPDYSYVGGSLRLVPTARLDLLTQAWQVKYGYDAKPFYEMYQACANLKGMVVTLSPTRCSLGFCDHISLEAEICDFSRSFSSAGGEVLCVLGQLSVQFHRGAEKQTLTLPSKRSVLAVAPSCRKGAAPLVKGTSAYIKRRYEPRPNAAYVIRNSKDDLECTIACQDEHGHRRGFMMEGRFKAKGTPEAELHFFVRAPCSESAKDAEQTEELKRAVAGQGKAAKDAPEMVPLMPWLLWLLQGYDDAWTLETAQLELARRLKSALHEEMDREPPALFVEEAVALQMKDARPYKPKSKHVKRTSFMPHVPDEEGAKLEALSALLAKALAVQLLQRSADALPATKSMNSASDVWEGLLRTAVLKALAAARKKSLGAVQRTSRDVEGKTKLKVVHHEYSASFPDADAVLLEKCSRTSPDGKFVAVRSALIVIDAFAEHHCSSLREESGFHFLHEKACGWNLRCSQCPMCRAEYDPRYNLGDLPRSPQVWPCHVCNFEVSITHQSLDLCRIVTSRRVIKSPLSSEEDVRRQKLFVSLDVAKHVASDGVGYRFLCKALKGQDKEDVAKPQVGAVVAPETENSAKGTNSRRGESLPPELHENFIDGRAGKDSNPDLRVYLLTGSSIQRRPSAKELQTLLETVRAAAETWGAASGGGRLEVRGRTLLTFDPRDVGRVLEAVRRAGHRAAELCGNCELAMCCPVLSYSGSGPVVTLLCSGNELVRAVGWRSLTAAESAALECLAADRPFSLLGLPDAWRDLGEHGLTWDQLVFAGVVTYCALDRHVVLKEDVADFALGTTGGANGMTFYKISAELESAMRLLQTEDAATWQAGHAIRQGYSVGMALNAHKFEPLAHSKGSISSVRSVGYDPCKNNMRNLVGSAADNQYGSTLQLMAVLHDFGTVMQEDSMPQCVDAFRHLTLRNHSISFVARTHWESNAKASLGHAAPLSKHVEGKSYSHEVGACIQDKSGLVDRPFTFVRSGQALCFILGGAEPEEDGEPGNLLRLAPCDLWVKKIKVEPFLEAGESRHKYEVQYLTMDLYNEGQKLGKLYQKFVSVLLEDWISGGRGRVTGLLSSSSISSRTAVQNLTRAWMTSLALASGVGNVSLVSHLSQEASLVREVLQSSRPLSASALTELRRKTPGSSVSNQGPMVSGRQGRYFGSCVQVMMSVLVAVQDASKPNGSINGVNETGRTAPGKIRLDPIMTELWRFLGFEQQEEVLKEGACSACSSCGKYLVSGNCDCADRRGQKRPRREVNVNPAFQSGAASLACANIDVCFEWEKRPEEVPPAVSVAPESAEWAAVPPNRGAVTMQDAQRRDAAARRAEKASYREKVGVGFSFSFGACPMGRVLADQFVFAMRALKKRAAWDSGDRTDGYTVVADGDKALWAEAVQRASDDVRRLSQSLRAFKDSGAELPLDSMLDIGGGLALGAEAGGTLQLHTSDERTKQLVIGATSFANSAKRVFRAFLVQAPELELLPLRNPNYSVKETCNESELRLEFERNVLGYLYLATTLAVLPVRRAFHRDASLVKAELRLLPGCPHVSARHIFGEDGRQLFFKDVVLGANPLARGWCTATTLPLKFVVYSARVEHYPTFWEKVPGIFDGLEEHPAAGSPQLEALLIRMDQALTSSPPALNGIDQRPVFEAVARDVEALQALPPSTCAQGVLDHADLKMGSRMYCIDCKDCTRYYETAAKDTAATLRDLEDTAVSASAYFRRNDTGNRRRIFEQGGGGWKARRTRASPLSIVAQAELWAFRCSTDEDVSYLTSALLAPAALEGVPGVAALLEGMPRPRPEEAAAEKVFLEVFFERHGGPDAWVRKAHAAVQLLLESAEELERDLQKFKKLAFNT